MANLWESGELRGIGKLYTNVIKKTARELGRSPDQIKVSLRSYYCKLLAVILHLFLLLGLRKPDTKEAQERGESEF